MTTEELYNKSRELLKEATAKKETDINSAISLIKQAIEICPEKDFADYFKLANYYHLAGMRDEAYGILQKLIIDLDANELFMYNMYKSLVYDKICTLNFKDELYKSYLFNFSLWLFNTTIAFACQARATELKNIIESSDKLNCLAPTKITRCFKKLNKISEKDQFNKSLHSYILSNENTFQELLNKSSLHPINSKSIQLLNDEDFMTIYRQINSGDFEIYYDSQLKPLLEN